MTKLKQFWSRFRSFWRKGQFVVVPVLVLLLVLGGLHMIKNDPRFEAVQVKLARTLNWEINAYSVILNGENIGTVEQTSMIENAWDTAVEKMNSGERQYYVSTEYVIQPVRAHGSTFTDEESLAEDFEGYLAHRTQSLTSAGISLHVGKVSFAFRSMDEIIELFTRLGQHCVGDKYVVTCTGIDDGVPTFDMKEANGTPIQQEIDSSKLSKEQKEAMIGDSALISVVIEGPISYQMNYLDEADYSTVDEAYQVCISDLTVEKQHKVVRGDTAWGIAKMYGLTLSELGKLNPDIKDLSKIKAGNKLTVKTAEPAVIVYKLMRSIGKRAISYKTVYVYDNTQYKTYSKTMTAGVKGVEWTVTETQYDMHGIQVASKVVDTAVLEQPTTRVVIKGTKKPPKFITPVYGGRRSDWFDSTGKSLGRVHLGVDIMRPTGTAVYASAAGTVTEAGYNSSSGNYIVIKHSGGYQTRYAHLSSINVKKGQYVAQGAFIGRVGMTGNATGPHLHFSIILNGKYVNPEKYIKVAH